MANKKTLGRGLHSLIPEINEDSDNIENSSNRKYDYQNPYKNKIEASLSELDEKSEKSSDFIQKINLDKINARTGQPRKNFDEEAINDLAASIKEYGLLNPIVVSKVEDSYEIIAGERRYRASKKAGLNEIDAIVKNYSDRDVEILSLVENVQREDLKALEEAAAYKKLSDDFDMTQEQIAKTMGKSRSYIANTMRLLKLEEIEKQALNNGEISPSQARSLLSISDTKQRKDTLTDFKSGKTNIRKVEKRNTNKKKIKEKVQNESYGPNIDDILIEDLEEKFMDELGSRVAINKTDKAYKLIIDCFTIEDIESLYKRMANEID